jgi:tetratricopeptide (TPR) repeat protein
VITLVNYRMAAVLLAAKSLVAAKPAEDGTRYRLLDTVRHYAADRLAETGGTDTARHRHALAFAGLARREREPPILAREQDNFRTALEWSLARGDQTGPQLARALGGFWLARGLLQEGRDWLERALARCPADEELRADLLRLLGTVLYETGDLNSAEAVLSEGATVAAATGARAVQARIRVQQAQIHEVHNILPGDFAGALRVCEEVIAILEAEADLGGLAEAWLLTGRLRFERGEWPADKEALEYAMSCARESGNHHAWMAASQALGTTLFVLPITADAAVNLVEQLLRASSGEPWAEANQLLSLSLLYAYAGRIADARAAMARSRSIYTSLGVKLSLAYSTIPAGSIEMIAGNPAAAERYWREGYETFRAMGDQRYLSIIAALLAEALYAQNRLNEAQRVTEDSRALAELSGPLIQIRWMSVRARILAKRGQLLTAGQLIDEAEAVITPTTWEVEKAGILMARAEVYWLAGQADQAEASLRTAWQIYEDLHVVPLEKLCRAALTSLADNPGLEHA